MSRVYSYGVFWFSVLNLHQAEAKHETEVKLKGQGLHEIKIKDVDFVAWDFMLLKKIVSCVTKHRSGIKLWNLFCCQFVQLIMNRCK